MSDFETKVDVDGGPVPVEYQSEMVAKKKKNGNEHIMELKECERLVSIHEDFDDEERDEIVDYIMDVMNSKKYQSNPQKFMMDWESKRGDTEEFIIPDDPAFDIITRFINA